MKLSQYAKHNSISYKTAWLHFTAGIIPNARQLPTGTIVVDPPPSPDKTEVTVVYARVSSSENKNNLASQARRVTDFCAARGWTVNAVVKECGSGLNDTRPRLLKILQNPEVTRLVVEHKDRLTRFGFNYIQTLWHGELVVINHVPDGEDDLMTDFVSLVTSFTARLYGRRRSRRQTEKLIRELKTEA